MQSFLWSRPHGRDLATYPSRSRLPDVVGRVTGSSGLLAGIYLVLLRVGLVKLPPHGETGGLLPRLFTLIHMDGIFSVTLSVPNGLRRRDPPVRRYSVLRSSDFPPRSVLIPTRSGGRSGAIARRTIILPPMVRLPACRQALTMKSGAGRCPNM